MGKGSKSRPLGVDRKQFENNWDKIFAAPDRDLAYESDNPLERPIETKVSSFFSDNGKKEAVVLLTDKGFMVELYEQSRYIKTVDCSGRSINWAEDVAENYTLGMI
jgi:predicted transcriptional regulator